MKFLRKMSDLCQNHDPRHIIYTDETWITQNHTEQYFQQLTHNTGGLKVPTDKSGRLACVIGPSFLFIEGYRMIFRAKEGTGDCHSEMNNQIFKEWFLSLLMVWLKRCIILVTWPLNMDMKLPEFHHAPGSTVS
jgi:hypothetical protein